MVKRVYEKPQKRDGTRILVDRLWPRGVRKEEVKIDLWLKEAAPSSELREWFGHDPKKWSRFKKEYFAELKGNREVAELLERARTGTDVTLLYGARDQKHNQAVALKEYLERRIL